jgi:hypothetical protein
VFAQSVARLREAGFHVFGLRAKPFADVAGCVRIAGGSMWSNRPCREIAFLDAIGACPAGGAAFTVAYPHWGYELELYPRPAIVRAGGRLLKRYGAVVGHHSHVPQPLAAVRSGNATRLLAYSLGNFCTGLRIGKYRWGTVCKADIGPGAEGIWQIGELHWRHTRVLSAPESPREVALTSQLEL